MYDAITVLENDAITVLENNFEISYIQGVLFDTCILANRVIKEADQYRK